VLLSQLRRKAQPPLRSLIDQVSFISLSKAPVGSRLKAQEKFGMCTFPRNLVRTAVNHCLSSECDFLHHPSPREPSALHKVQESSPLLACLLAVTQLVEVLKLKNFFLNKFEGHGASCIAFSKPNTTRNQVSTLKYGKRWAKIIKHLHPLSLAINRRHHFDLVVPLADIRLIYTNRINPEIPIFLRMPQSFQSSKQIRLHLLRINAPILPNINIRRRLYGPPTPR
jgi:hypothetical protein